MNAPLDAAPTRHISLEGSVNFRDLGGYRTEDGRTLRWRRVFRADGLSNLTEPDLHVLKAFRIATVIDLRSGSEVEAGRFPVDAYPVDFHHLPMLDVLPHPDTYKVTPGILATQYEEMTRDASAQIAQALRVLSEAGALPAVIHCTAGKDRTGVMAAVLLGILGVEEETIVADYALSETAMDALRQKLIERYPDGHDLIVAADEIFSAAPSNIRQLLQRLSEDFGSVTDYVESIGVGPSVIAALEDALLE